MAYKEEVCFFGQTVEIVYRTNGRFPQYIAMNGDRRMLAYHQLPYYILEENRWDYGSNLTQYNNRCSGMFLGYYEKSINLRSQDSLMPIKDIILINGEVPATPLAELEFSQYMYLSRKRQNEVKLAKLFQNEFVRHRRE